MPEEELTEAEIEQITWKNACQECIKILKGLKAKEKSSLLKQNELYANTILEEAISKIRKLKNE